MFSRKENQHKFIQRVLMTRAVTDLEKFQLPRTVHPSQARPVSAKDAAGDTKD
jgi:hypothetical protein